MSAPLGDLRIGPAGWSYPDWKGVVYPKPEPKNFQHLPLIAQWFDVAEINNSFYRIPERRHAANWAHQIEGFPNFRFTAKLYQGFTHERRPTRAQTLAYLEFLEPLMEASRLGALLLQFPWSFRNTPDNRAYAERLFFQFRDFPLVFEVRHQNWWTPDTFAWLRDQCVSVCNIDQPALRDNILPDDVLTGPVAYIRFHGRNEANWWAEEQPYYGARYDYLYDDAELAPWMERARRLQQKAESTYLIFNNHHRGDAVINGLEAARQLGLSKGTLTGALAQEYPERVARLQLPVQMPPEQTDLFQE